MVDGDRHGEDDDREPVQGRGLAPDAGGPRSTRRGVLRRTSTLGALSIPGLGGFETTDAADALPTDSRDRPAPVERAPPGALQPSDPPLDFERTYDGYESPVGVVRPDDGGYVIVGNDRPDTTWLVRTDPEGAPVFEERYEITGWPSSRTTGIVADDGGFVILGISYEQGCWLRSVDAEGDTCWFRKYKDCTFGCSSLVRTASGGYTWITNPQGMPTAREVHVVDGDGATVWRRSYAPEDAEQYQRFRLENVVQLAGGGFAFVGTASLDARRGLVWVVRVDADGERLDEDTYESPHPEWEYPIVMDAVPTTDGGVALVGSVSETGEQIEGEFLFLALGSDLEPGIVRTYDPRGCGLALGNALVQTADGGFALLGEGAACEVEDRYRYAFVARLLRLEPDGSVRWTFTYPEDVSSSGRWARGYDVVETTDGGIAAVGTGSDDVWLFGLTGEEPT